MCQDITQQVTCDNHTTTITLQVIVNKVPISLLRIERINVHKNVLIKIADYVISFDEVIPISFLWRRNLARLLEDLIWGSLMDHMK